METGKILKKIQTVIPEAGIVLLAVFARLIPHPANFTPIGGLALISGAKFSSKKAYLLPIAAMFISDLVIGLHRTIPFVYLSFLITVLIGRLLKKRQGAGYLFIASLISSLVFFLITNFGVWLTGTMYVRNIGGLATAYLMGLPFFRNTLFSDFFYSFFFFYGYRYFRSISVKYSPVKAD